MAMEMDPSCGVTTGKTRIGLKAYLGPTFRRRLAVRRWYIVGPIASRFLSLSQPILGMQIMHRLA